MAHSQGPPDKRHTDCELPIFTSNPSIEVPAITAEGRPVPVKFMSTPAYQSPLRHHKRAASSTRQVKETSDARSQYSNSLDDGSAEHRINQYLVKQEIGRGSFGAVHLAVDQYGHQYAVKEFSKSRLRKRAQSNLLRRPAGKRSRALPAGLGFNSPLHRHSTHEENNSFELIKEEIAIMKKLNHPNLVSLVEVLDDPEEDSLYMVMEMCKKGVVMQVGLEERADPYDEEQSRCWFRDMLLGLEYLHAQGIIHRDIKPDNCLITEDNILKIVDFGVSEMFDKNGEMKTAKSAGSPAFMPPELCIAKHGQVSGRAADIWSMGCTLYCLVFGRIPFEEQGMIELYQSIRAAPLEMGGHCSDELKDLLHRLMEKDPDKRINMEQIREHPWVTRQGDDPLLSKDENVSIIIDPPTDAELNAAITGNMGHLITVVRAVKRFKQLLFRRRPERIEGILGSASRIVQPPLSIRPSGLRKSKSQDTDNRRPVEAALTVEGVHHKIEIDDQNRKIPLHEDEMAYVQYSSKKEVSGDELIDQSSACPKSELSPHCSDTAAVDNDVLSRHTVSRSVTIPDSKPETAPSTPTIGKGHAHDPLEDLLFLNIGTGEDCDTTSNDACIVSESPSNVDINVYEKAYEEEVQRIISQRKEHHNGSSAKRLPTLYLTRRVENMKSIRDNDCIFDEGQDARRDFKVSLKSFVTKTKKDIEARGELQKLRDGKEGKLSRTMQNMREAKRLVEEARENVKREEREREMERSRSATPIAERDNGGSRQLSRSRTPVDSS